MALPSIAGHHTTKHSNAETERGFGIAGRAVRWTKEWDTLVEVCDYQVYLQSFTFGEWIDGNDRLSSTRI